VAIGILGFAAVLVAVRAVHGWSLGEKIVWIALSFILLIVEVKSIYNDRDQYERRQHTADIQHLAEVADMNLRFDGIQQSIAAENRTARKAGSAIGLKERALTLASEINGFLANTQIAAGYGQGGYGERRFGGAGASQSETMTAFYDAFGARVRSIHDALKKRGYTDAGLDHEYQHPMNAFSIKEIADGIERLADRLPDN
jgi:cell division protein FtsL